MQAASYYKTLADKLIFHSTQKDFNTPDSLLSLVAFAFNEEEARIASQLSFVPRTARAIARKVKRPFREVDPILKSLADRILIGGLSTGKDTVYNIIPLIPGVYETQIMHSRSNSNDAYGKEFARLFQEFFNEVGELIKPVLDGKDVEAMRIIPIEKSINMSSDVNVVALSTDIYSEMVDRNNSFCIIDCPCRNSMELIDQGCDKPKDVCSAMGYVADFVVEKGIARRVSKQGFIEAKMRAVEAGLVNMVDNMQDPLQVCSCCDCCCILLRLAKQHNVPSLFANSHFEAKIDSDKCTGCSVCEEDCPLHAITLKDDTTTVDYARCIGCGVCVTRCDENAIFLKERSRYQAPPDNIINHAIHRYMEIKGYNKNAILPRASLGAGRLISKLVQPRVAGPGYKGLL